MNKLKRVFFPVLLLCLITSNSYSESSFEVHARGEKLQELLMPLHDDANRIYGIYSNYYDVNGVGYSKPLPSSLVKQVEKESQTFFSNLSSSVQKIKASIPDSKRNSCEVAYKKLDERVFEPLRKQTQDIEQIKSGMGNDFAFTFMAAAQGISLVFASEACF